VRHKILDVIGDMALIGRPLIGHLVAHRGGHALHTAFAAQVLSQTDAWTLVDGVPEAVDVRTAALRPSPLFASADSLARLQPDLLGASWRPALADLLSRLRQREHVPILILEDGGRSPVALRLLDELDTACLQLCWVATTPRRQR
jgi:hypothetical protein